ncbi:hypothetical protein ACIQBJ_25000 [Kitasatospora sp. NPDC088391]|uniref:hypothetical protein n=1 Tax=Kitasatospora sp. NPDC088391 TaxID=3364074 RepID=UPI00382F0B0C
MHGTDLLFAEQHRDQLRVLRERARLADAIVVPTAAMADHLTRLAPRTDTGKIHHIPWGVPDHLLTTPLAPAPTCGCCTPGGSPRKRAAASSPKLWPRRRTSN